MAVILPDIPLAAPPEVARVHRLLKQLPDESFSVWHRLHIHPEPGPDFWVLHGGGRALWIKVSTLTPAGAKSFHQVGLFGAEAGRPAEAEHQALIGFASTCFGESESFFKRVPALVLFPGLNQPDLQKLMPLAEIPGDVRWLCRDEIVPATFAQTVESRLGLPLSADDISALRRVFTPEVVVPVHFTVRKPVERHTRAESTPYLLDYDQERILKTDLELSADARAAARNFNLRLINGVAGSGKSLVIVYRAQLLRRLYPNKSILGLTHNQPLIRDLRARYTSLNPGGKPVYWQTFYEWCKWLWHQTGHPWVQAISGRDRERLVTRIWHRHLADTSISERLLADELDWCKDRLIFSLDDYLAADRSGRGFALNETQRQRLFVAFEAYQAELNRMGRMDWGDVPRQLWRWVQAKELQLPHYDVILVDEAQFFAPIWFELIKHSVRPRTGHLFLVADPTQGFLKRRQSWLASGLEVRGRVHRLKKSYRTTREILDFATLLYRQRLPDDDDDIVSPDLLDMPHGLVPQIIPLTSGQDEITRVVNEIEQLVAQGIPKQHLLVIHTDWHGVDRLVERLQGRLGESGAIDAKEQAPGDAIRVCTLNAVTGLESPIVFLAGAHLLFEQEQSVRLSDEERNELVRDNTRKLYMAITRAGQRLIMTYVGEIPGHLKSLLVTGLLK